MFLSGAWTPLQAPTPHALLPGPHPTQKVKPQPTEAAPTSLSPWPAGMDQLWLVVFLSQETGRSFFTFPLLKELSPDTSVPAHRDTPGPL